MSNTHHQNDNNSGRQDLATPRARSTSPSLFRRILTSANTALNFIGFNDLPHDVASSTLNLDPVNESDLVNDSPDLQGIFSTPPSNLEWTNYDTDADASYESVGVRMAPFLGDRSPTGIEVTGNLENMTSSSSLP